MNLPNKLTLLRIFLVPVFVALMLLEHSLAGLIVFVMASLTDFLDGQIARKYNLITTFGKLMDPLADKILVMSAMLLFVQFGHVPAWVVIIILAREFLVTSLRLIAAGDGVVIAADMWGKVKTVTQMVWILCTLLWMVLDSANLFSSVFFESIMLWLIFLLMVLSVFFSILSGANYVYKNRGFFDKC